MNQINKVAPQYKFIEQFFKEAPIAFVVLNYDGFLQYANNHFLSSMGLEIEDLPNIHYKDITHPDDINKVGHKIKDLIQGKIKSFKIEKRYITKKKRVIWGSLFVSSINISRDQSNQILAIIQDVTAEKEAELTAKKRLENLNAILENTEDSIWSIDKNYKLLVANTAFKRMVSTYLGREPIEGESIIFDFLPPDIKTYWKLAYEKALSGKSFKVDFRPQNNNKLILHLTFNPIYDVGEVIGVNIISRDITEIKKKELAVKQQDEDLLHIQQEAKISSWRWNKTQNITVYTGSLLGILGSFDKNVIHLNPQDLFQKIARPEDKKDLWKKVKRKIKENKPFSYETRIVTESGKIKYVKIIGSECYLDSTGNFIQRGSLQDITAFKLQEKNTLENKERLKALINNSTVGVGLVTREGIILKANEAFAKILGFTKKEMLRQNALELTHPEDREHTKSYMDSLFDGLINSYHTEKRYIKKSGEIIWVELTLTVVKDTKGKPLYTIGQVQDITARKKEEADVRKVVKERTAKLEAINKELEAFSYSVSHDLRAPLRSINGFSKILLDEYCDTIDDEGKMYLQKIHGASNRMAGIINDLLDLSRISQYDYRKSEVNLSEVVFEVINTIKTENQYNKTRIIVEEDLVCCGDRQLIKILLTNILTNAFKYSSKNPKPEIIIGQKEIEGKKTFFVKDNGVGFDMIYSKDLFKDFLRLHPAEEFEGTGVGLAIVKRIIDRHNGQIWAEGKVGDGAIFYFSI